MLSIFLLHLLIAITIAMPCQELFTLKENTYFSDIDELMECFNEIEISLEEKKNITSIVNSLLEGYVFDDILKNPPQPFENEEYYPTVDLFAKLKEIQHSEDTSYYHFISQMVSMFTAARDGHFSIYPSTIEDNTEDAEEIEENETIQKRNLFFHKIIKT